MSADVSEDTRDVVTSLKIKCDKNQLDAKNFRLAVQIFRSMQLEDTGRVMMLKPEGGFDPMVEDHVYRAVAAMKVIDNKGERLGWITEHRQCGIYHAKYMVPLLVSMAGIAILSMMAYVRWRKLRVIIPYDAAGWFQQLPRNGQPVVLQGDSGPGDWTSTPERRSRKGGDEIVLVQDLEHGVMRVLHADEPEVVTGIV